MSFLSEVKVKTESKFSQWDLCGSSLQESDVDNLMRGDLLAFDIDAENGSGKRGVGECFPRQ